MRGEGRLEWLEGARILDLALRGPRPPAGLQGISDYLADWSGRDREVRKRAAEFWRAAKPMLHLLERQFSAARPSVADLTAALRETASQLSGDEVWAGAAGRAAADLFTLAEPASVSGPTRVQPASFPQLLDQLMAQVAIRPPFGQHPRVFIWGLLEARLQHADLVVLGGLNEGTWPALPTPDPWLAPRIRHELGLPGLERRIGLAAHDFATALGARSVLVTRARRDARAPAVASRFWLRLEAMTGGLSRSPQHKSWAQALDRPAAHLPAAQPAPSPAIALRPTIISVTEVDRLKADPFAFYARRMLKLQPLDAIDADPSPAWRGTAVHDVLEAWMKEDECDPSKLRPRAEALLQASSAHPLMRALWQPRLIEAIDWIAEEVRRNKEGGRLPLKAEASGRIEIAGVTLQGRADRIDKAADGSLVILDYKTGTPPGPKAVAEGYSMQLGLLGLMAERGGFDGLAGVPSCFEYWSLAKKNGKIGYVASPVGGKNGIDPAEFTTMAARNFIVAAQTWLTGGAPFTAKLHPQYAPYAEYDQLMRLDEWYGRETNPRPEATPYMPPP
jgi:ATP-dependent helicase/nuclease subunit B